MHQSASIKGCQPDLGQSGTWPLWPSVWALWFPPGRHTGAMNRHGRMLCAVSQALACVAHVSMAAAQCSLMASLQRQQIWVAMETATSALTSFECIFQTNSDAFLNISSGLSFLIPPSETLVYATRDAQPGIGGLKFSPEGFLFRGLIWMRLWRCHCSN